MFGHFPELVIIMVIALIVFGPEKMPEMARNAGKMVREFRTAMDQVMNPVDIDVPDDFSAFYQEEMERESEEIPSPQFTRYDPEHFEHPPELGVEEAGALDAHAHPSEVTFPHIAAPPTPTPPESTEESA